MITPETIIEEGKCFRLIYSTFYDVYLTQCIVRAQAFSIAFVEYHSSFLCSTVRFCTFLCVPYASELSLVGHYLSIAWYPVCSLWPRIGLRRRFANPVRNYKREILPTFMLGDGVYVTRLFNCIYLEVIANI